MFSYLHVVTVCLNGTSVSEGNTMDTANTENERSFSFSLLLMTGQITMASRGCCRDSVRGPSDQIRGSSCKIKH